MEETILSVGIDIGTSTSQVIFSRLTIQNKSAISRVPQINITDKEIVYQSDIHFTPLLNNNIDEEKLAKIVKEEYRKAGILPTDLTVGVVIITGESSRKDNSSAIVHALSDLAGDFVVATAGPDLEGIIAGRGAGTAALSKESHRIMANVDIGGGTSNIAIFEDGLPVDTACLDIGGRQIRFKDQQGTIDYIAPKTKLLCEKMGLASLRVGNVASTADLEKLTIQYCKIIAQTLGFLPKTDDVELLMTDHLLKKEWPITSVTFSGGVADIFYGHQPGINAFKYNDIGIIFGQSMQSAFPSTMNIVKSGETIRATVIGAGAFSASLSGATIDANDQWLPLKNIPIIKFSNSQLAISHKELVAAIKQKIDWVWDKKDSSIALALDLEASISYHELQKIAKILIESSEELQQNNTILIIIIENDLAKALGQLLSTAKPFPFIVLDGIHVEDGDYIDIGKNLTNHSVVPVVVKSLIFNK